MTTNEPTAPRPVPKPPATGPDAWKNQPTNCWPTPANMAKARERSAPLDPNYAPELAANATPAHVRDDARELADEQDTWSAEGGTDDDGAPEAPHGDRRDSLGDDPQMPERFRDTVRRLDDLPNAPVTEHAESYDAVHRDLRQSLDDIERPS